MVRDGPVGMHTCTYGVVWHNGLNVLWYVQVNGYRRARKLVACLYNENRVVIHDLDTNEQNSIEVEAPWKTSMSSHLVAVATEWDQLRLFSYQGDLVHIVPDSEDAYCTAFHPHTPNILAIGFKDGSVRIWDVRLQTYVSLFKEHAKLIIDIHFSPDGRLLLTCMDKKASILTLDTHFSITSRVQLERHSSKVLNILSLPSSNQCVTCSSDMSLKVWDCKNGVCLHTLTHHTGVVVSLDLHPQGKCFASASHDHSVIIWCCLTFEVLHRIEFAGSVQAVVFCNNDAMFVALHDHGVVTCNPFSGEIFPVLIPGKGSGYGLALCMPSVYVAQFLYHIHFTSITAPVRKP